MEQFYISFKFAIFWLFWYILLGIVWIFLYKHYKKHGGTKTFLEFMFNDLASCLLNGTVIILGIYNTFRIFITLWFVWIPNLFK